MYIPFTTEQKERARQTDIGELLRQYGGGTGQTKERERGQSI